MPASPFITIAATIAISLLFGAACVPVITFITWLIVLRKDGEPISEVWKMLGFKFVIATLLILSSVLMPTAYRISRLLLGMDGGEPKKEHPKCACQCPCEACKMCQRKVSDHADM